MGNTKRTPYHFTVVDKGEKYPEDAKEIPNHFDLIHRKHIYSEIIQDYQCCYRDPDEKGWTHTFALYAEGNLAGFFKCTFPNGTGGANIVELSREGRPESGQIEDEILDMIKQRMDDGRQAYGSFALVGVDKRDFIQESLEEILDLSVYIARKLLMLRGL
jgi:hypothetical protein